VIDVGELTVKGASTKPRVTERTLTKFPVRVTVLPMRPRSGAKAKSVRDGETVKMSKSTAVPTELVARQRP